MRDAPQGIAPLTSDKRKLLLLMLKEQGVSAVQQPTIPQRKDDEPLPLSFAQQRLWFLDQLEPGNAAYNIATAVRLQGALNVAALHHSFNELLRRHESLRTRFAMVTDVPHQVIDSAASVALPLIDLSALSAVEAQREAERLVAREGRRGFDLAQGPLLRVQLLHLSDAEHILLLTLHHIIGDGWSVGILIKEVAALYSSYSSARASSLPALPIQYADYAVWQRGWLQGAVLEEQLQYWTGQLGGARPVLALPTDYPRPAIQSYRGAAVTLSLSGELSARLEQLSRQEGVTLFMLLLAAFQVLLYRYTQEEDVVVGTPIANRTRAETEGLIGFFVNTLALRTDLSGAPSFRELLQRVREVSLGAYAHQDLPFELLVEALRPERSLSHQPLFQVMFNVLNFSSLRIELPKLILEAFEVPESASKFDLTLYVRQPSTGIQLELVYNADLLTQERMTRMLAQLETLLAQIVARPEEKITHFSLVTSAQRALLPDPTQPLAAEWHGCIQQHFSEQAQRVPDRIALEDAYGCWRYRELDELSTQLAAHLRAGGIKCEDVVAIYAHRSAALVWAMLATLKAGAGFVMLDPAYPAARLIETLRVAQPRAWLQLAAAGGLPEVLADFVAASAYSCQLELPASLSEAQQLPMNSLSDEAAFMVEPDDLAYIAFTSGSTGLPKGVLGTHRPLSHFLHWHTNTFELHEQDRFSMLSGLSHDPLLRDILTPLWLGATLCIPDGELMGSPGWLKQWLIQNCITVAHLTPARGQLLLTPAGDSTKDQTETADALRYVFFGGDVLTTPDVLSLNDFAESAQIVNFYGTTETPQAMSYYLVNTPMAVSSRVPVGRGIAGVQLLVLSAGEELAGIGDVGEIYVRTPYLARGYKDDETLTRERFKTNPLTQAEGDRLYRTGDIGRYLPSGDVECLGRADQQVKLRGYRIELGEIEWALQQHAQIAEAVVVLREEQLVAYVVGVDERVISSTELHQFLRVKVPDYMVPARFVQLERLPLTANGKLDRRALPAPELSGPADSYVAPQTPVEEVLAGIWQELLGVERVGVRDNFFELGGHSLLATQVISRLRSALAVDLPLRSLFEQPTVAGLGQCVEAALRGGEPVALPPLLPVGRDELLPLSFAQQRLWFIAQLEPESGAYNMPASLRLTGRLDYLALQRTLCEVVRRHEVLRTTFVNYGGAARQQITAEAQVALPLIDLSALASGALEAEVTRLARAEAGRPFDLSVGPLLRASLLRLGAEEHVLLFTMHHIISDGWSMGILIKEVVALYAAYRSQHPSPLPELAIQYADYAVWQREWLQGEVLEEQLQYWRAQLAGAPPVLSLPTEYARPAGGRQQRAAREVCSVPAELTAALKRLGQVEGVTLYMVLLAAFKVLLYRYTQEEDLVVGTPIANRTQAETEGLIGFFVNTLVLRTDLSGNPTFDELLPRVREVCLGAYAHQELPFEMLIEALQPERVLGQQALAQVMFVMQNMPRAQLELPGLTVSWLGQDQEQAKYDLLLTVVEGAGLQATFSYNAELFEAATIQRLAGHFKTLLEGIATNPEARLFALPLFSEAEAQQLLYEWNETETAYPKQCLQHWFEAQAALRPEAIALVYKDEYLSYGELNERANQLAHYLGQRGVGVETLVGVLLERSVELVVGLLGILKAGAAYVPLDPAYPLERLAFMLSDSAASLLLTQEQLRARLATAAVPVICLDTEWAAIARQPKVNPAPPVTVENLAYVIYTSGSTGKPKGVAIAHHSTSAFLQWAGEVFSASQLAVVLASTSICFDLSIFELFAPLSQGGTVLLSENVFGLATLPAAPQVTLINTVPSAMAELVRLGGIPGSVRTINLAGEALPNALVQEIYRQPTIAQVFNLYGPSEDTTYSTYTLVRKGQPEQVTIGHPVANTQVYVLDGQQQPVPQGIVGELYLGGAGLARSYLQRPELTAERFVPNAFGKQAGTRLYRTGDLVRYLADGEIQYLGRADHQVKLRGFRIELDEIQAVLNQHPVVRESLLLVREDHPGDKRLVAYVVTRQPSAAPDLGALRSHLQAQLPAYMIPGSFVVLAEFPLTPNGKLDRRALPAPDLSGAADRYVAPQTPVEEVLVGMWRELLRVERVGVTDNFFELGGHSLLLTQLASRIHETFQVELPLQVLFTTPTIVEITKAIAIQQVEQENLAEMAQMLDDLQQLSPEEITLQLEAESALMADTGDA